MDGLDQEKLVKIQSKLEELMALVDEMLSGVTTVNVDVQAVEKYISRSGNTTWKLYYADADGGGIVYLRQSQKKLLEELNMWTWLNELVMDEETRLTFSIEIVRDGDFYKMVKAYDF